MEILERGNLEIRYDEKGKDNEETLFLINGGFMQIESWEPVAKKLAEDYHIVLHDMRCQGNSSCPEETGFEQHVKDIISLMDELDINKGNFVGISYGGIVCQFLALNHPDRLKTLTLVATLSEVTDDSYYGILRWIEGGKSGKAKNFVLSWINDVYSNRYIRKNPNLLERIINRYNQLDTDYENYAKLLKSMAKLRNNPLTEKIRDINVPTLVISGGKSITREFTKKIHDQIENSKHIEVPDSGHAIMVEKPHELTTMIRGFLEEY